MRNIFIITDRKDFQTALVRGEALPYGVSILPTEIEAWKSEASEHTVALRVNLRAISATAFALWILRRMRSIAGDHRIEISGDLIPLQMPQAIDLIAEAVMNGKRTRLDAA
jgi:hypothetical protein